MIQTIFSILRFIAFMASLFDDNGPGPAVEADSCPVDPPPGGGNLPPDLPDPLAGSSPALSPFDPGQVPVTNPLDTLQDNPLSGLDGPSTLNLDPELLAGLNPAQPPESAPPPSNLLNTLTILGSLGDEANNTQFNPFDC